ncbi:MAG: hypothetical protein JXB25_12280, partial [Deltaproteobacteria bacterium]|nr:hypothetical protein [Deltaproteobacteria bacterium]
PPRNTNEKSPVSRAFFVVMKAELLLETGFESLLGGLSVRFGGGGGGFGGLGGGSGALGARFGALGSLGSLTAGGNGLIKFGTVFSGQRRGAAGKKKKACTCSPKNHFPITYHVYSSF